MHDVRPMACPVHRRRRLSRDGRDPHVLLDWADVRRAPKRRKLQPVGDLLLSMRERRDTLSQGQQQVAAVMLAAPDFAVGNTSMFMASDAQARFSRLGLVSNFYFDAHLQLISAATMNKHDVALAISHVGRMPFLLETVDVAKEQGAMIIAITQPDTPLAARADIVLPADPSMRVGTEAYLAQMAYLEILMVGTGLRRGPPALRQLKRVRQVLQERGVDSETHPVLERAWSKGDALHP